MLTFLLIHRRGPQIYPSSPPLIQRLASHPQYVLDHASISKCLVCNRSDRRKSLDWLQYIRAEETLVAATLLLVALVTGSGAEAATPAFRRSLSFMNTVIDNQLSCLSMTNDLESNANISPEDRLIQCLRAMTRIKLMRFVVCFTPKGLHG
jgi:hypothetical protein